jgi:hypothetical protein
MAVTNLANTEIAFLRCLASRWHGNAATCGLNKVRQGFAHYSFFLFDQIVIAVTDSLWFLLKPGHCDIRFGARKRTWHRNQIDSHSSLRQTVPDCLKTVSARPRMLPRWKAFPCGSPSAPNKLRDEIARLRPARARHRAEAYSRAQAPAKPNRLRIEPNARGAQAEAQGATSVGSRFEDKQVLLGRATLARCGRLYCTASTSPI